MFEAPKHKGLFLLTDLVYGGPKSLSAKASRMSRIYITIVMYRVLCHSMF